MTMADVLIMGMEMPNYGEKYVEYAEAAFLPEGHGRLVDEKWIKKAMTATLESLKKNPKMDNPEAQAHLVAAFATLSVILDNAPTIVPAEGGHTDGNGS